MHIYDRPNHSLTHLTQSTHSCCTIMGRKETEEMSASQIFYPCMQAADVFYLKADICQLGMDQRKVNMLAREYVQGCIYRLSVFLSVCLSVSIHMKNGIVLCSTYPVQTPYTNAYITHLNYTLTNQQTNQQTNCGTDTQGTRR